MIIRKAISIAIISMAVLLVGAFMSSCSEKEAIEVTDIVFTNISSGKRIMSVGDEFAIKYLVLPENLQETAEVVWETSDKNVARVRKGRVTAEGPGKATITASCGKAQTSVVIEVKAVQIESLSFPADIEVYLGVPTKVEFTDIEPADGSLTTIDWEIEVYGDDYGDATFELTDGDLYITGTRIGVAGLVGKIGGSTIGLCEIIVKEHIPVTNITMSLSKSKVTFGESLTVSASVKPSNASIKDVTISCSPSDYVTINGNTITARQSAGTVTVFANADGVTASADFEIVPPPLSMTISHEMANNSYCFLSPDSSVGDFPASAQLKLVANNNAVDLSKAVWKSSVPSIVEVSGNGVITAKGHGYAQITAELDGATASLDVRSVKMSAFTMKAYSYYDKAPVASINTANNKFTLRICDPAFSSDPNTNAFEYGLSKYYKVTPTSSGAFTIVDGGGAFTVRAATAGTGSVSFSLNNGSSLTLSVIMRVNSLTFIGKESGKNYGTVQKGGTLNITRTDSDSRPGYATFETINVWCNPGSSYDPESAATAGTYSWKSSSLSYDPFWTHVLDQSLSGTHVISLAEFDTSFSVTLTVNKQSN